MVSDYPACRFGFKPSNSDLTSNGVVNVPGQGCRCCGGMAAAVGAARRRLSSLSQSAFVMACLAAVTETGSRFWPRPAPATTRRPSVHLNMTSSAVCALSKLRRCRPCWESGTTGWIRAKAAPKGSSFLLSASVAIRGEVSARNGRVGAVSALKLLGLGRLDHSLVYSQSLMKNSCLVLWSFREPTPPVEKRRAPRSPCDDDDNISSAQAAWPSCRFSCFPCPCTMTARFTGDNLVWSTGRAVGFHS